MVGLPAETTSTWYQRCSMLQPTITATLFPHTPFPRLVGSATLGTAEQHLGTQDHWTCSSAGLFIDSSGAARQKAKWSRVSKSESLKIPPEAQEGVHPHPQITADLKEGNFVLWRSWHPNTTLTSTAIRKAKWGIINSLLHKQGLLWKDSNYCYSEGSLSESRRLLWM